MRSRLLVLALAAFWLAWVGLSAGLAFAVGDDATDYADASMACALPNNGSDHGQASWGWWPPGETCRRDNGQVFQRPEQWRSVALVGLAVGLVVLPAGTVTVARRGRNWNTEDDQHESFSLEDVRP